MPVVSINIGPKRVHLTAYCPDDELGLLACEFVCRRAAELLDGTTADELWSWLIARDPGYAELKRLLDAGWRLPKNGDYTVDPKNVLPELRIIRHLIRERLEQCAGGPPASPDDAFQEAADHVDASRQRAAGFSPRGVATGPSRPRLSETTGTGRPRLSETAEAGQRSYPRSVGPPCPTHPAPLRDRPSRSEVETAKEGPAEAPPAHQGERQGGDERKED